MCKYADEGELRQLVKDILVSFPEAKEIVAKLQPHKMPIKPTGDNDLVLTHCFMCATTRTLQNPLYLFHNELKICSQCNSTLHDQRHGTDMTRDRVQARFGFSKKEAEQIPHKSGRHGYFGSTINIYKLSNVMTAVVKKHGSLYNFASARIQDRLADTQARAADDAAFASSAGTTTAASALSAGTAAHSLSAGPTAPALSAGTAQLL